MKGYVQLSALLIAEFNQIFDHFVSAVAQLSNFAENSAKNLIFLAWYAMTSQHRQTIVLGVPDASFFTLRNTAKLIATLPIPAL